MRVWAINVWLFFAMTVVAGKHPHTHRACLQHEKFDAEYDRAKVPPYNGNDPRPPLVV